MVQNHPPDTRGQHGQLNVLLRKEVIAQTPYQETDDEERAGSEQEQSF